ncbi:uncharacterized protein LOC141969450 isoform X2 [Athene noctua]|uniref:uncharacterized protein LOC141969450 isoform X2 n=1 Tax=Athene noctua TaxID=126797 RepID=UPI003EBE4566
MSSALKQQLFFRSRIVGEVRSISCYLCVSGGTRASTGEPVNSRGDGHSFGRAKPHTGGAVRGEATKRFSLVLWVPSRQPLESDEHLRRGTASDNGSSVDSGASVLQKTHRKPETRKHPSRPMRLLRKTAMALQKLSVIGPPGFQKENL